MCVTCTCKKEETSQLKKLLMGGGGGGAEGGGGAREGGGGEMGQSNSTCSNPRTTPRHIVHSAYNLLSLVNFASCDGIVPMS